MAVVFCADAIAGGSDLGCDDRAFAMSAVGSMDVASSVVYFYPRYWNLCGSHILSQISIAFDQGWKKPD
jgi:hypothetical protein